MESDAQNNQVRAEDFKTKLVAAEMQMHTNAAEFSSFMTEERRKRRHLKISVQDSRDSVLENLRRIKRNLHGMEKNISENRDISIERLFKRMTSIFHKAMGVMRQVRDFQEEVAECER